jgi:putative transposase
MMQKTYKFRIYPNKNQSILLNKTFGCCRFAWNSWVENFNKTVDKVFLTPKQFKKSIEWMKEVSSAAIQQKEQDFKEFKNQFFNKKRKNKMDRPSFKSRRGRQSYRLPNQKFRIEGNKIRLEKIGYIKMIMDRIIPQDVKFVNVTISKDLEDFFVSILVEEIVQPIIKTGKEIGIDVGLKFFATFSDGTIIDNPRFFRESQAELKRAQQHLSRKKKGSNRRFRAIIKVAKIHRKIKGRRNFFLHNLSSYLVNNFDVIVIENLNISGMLKNRHLSKSISDASWAEFFRQLDYKCQWYGKELRRINRFEPTSKTCSVCGFFNKNFTLAIREWICPCCGTKHDRDVNAAINILSAGVEADQQTQRATELVEVSKIV